MRQVVDDFVERQTILYQLYNKNGYKGREDIYQQISNQY